MLIDKAKKYFMNTYASFPIVIDRGEGVYVYDNNDKKYLDFVAGIAVNALGYQGEEYKNALIEQINKFTHCSNLYYNQPAIETAEILVKHSGLDKVFFP
jgi:acetylornithine/N-succinyldiaminopimelate aminotransferase